MYKNQLQELAQRSCFNLPSYACIREGPDHAPRFKATVNFNGETFESPQYCTTLRQAEHSAAEMALNALAGRGPSNSLAARILDETGVYKNLLQEVSQRVGASLPVYETLRSGLGHLPVFTCTVELAGVIFTGEPAKNKKQAEKNAAMAAWTSLKMMVQQSENATQEKVKTDEQEHVTVARALQRYLARARMARERFPIRFPTQATKLSSTLQPPATSSKILPFICHRQARSSRPLLPSETTGSVRSQTAPQSRFLRPTVTETMKGPKTTLAQPTGPSSLPRFKPKFPAAGAEPYIPIRHYTPHHHHRAAAPVTIRNAVPVFSSPPLPPPPPPPPPPCQSPRMMRPPPPSSVPLPVRVRPVTPIYRPPQVQLEKLSLLDDSSPFAMPQAQRENPSSGKMMMGRADQQLTLRQIPLFLPQLSTAPPRKMEVRADSLFPKVPAVPPTSSAAP